MRLKDDVRDGISCWDGGRPRGSEGVARVLERAKKEFDELPEDERWEFDQESLVNPYADTRILYGDPETEVSTHPGGHRPGGRRGAAGRQAAREGHVRSTCCWPTILKAGLSPVSKRSWVVQADVWRNFGVSIAYGDAVMSDRMAEITRAPASAQQRADRAAPPGCLDLPFMCCHTPADNNVNEFVQARCDELGADATVDELLDMLKSIPEYRRGRARRAPAR